MMINIDKKRNEDITIREFYFGENDILLVKFKEELLGFEKGQIFEELSQSFTREGSCIHI